MENKLNRWRIEGKLTTTSQLHIGSGYTTTRKEIKNKKEKDKEKGEEAKIAAIVTDYDDKPYLPGTTIKGNLRAYLEQTNQDNKIIEKLFGSQDPKKKDSCGGALEFWNAKIEIPTNFNSQHIPYWKGNSLTGITASTVIDRQTSTAADEKLFYTEYVPAGITFKIVITGQDLDKKEMALLLYALNGFTTKMIKLGASEADGWGEFQWELDTTTYIGSEEIRNWIKSPGELVAYDIKGQDRKNELLHDLARKHQKSTTENVLTIEIMLTFNSPFLVNDTSRNRELKNKNGIKTFGNHYPLLDVNGKVILPSSSMRGAFRSQAEKILRTLGNGQSACFDHKMAERKACDSVYEVDNVKESCPACHVFGFSGWRSPIQFSDFTFIQNAEKGKIKRQQFVAIDRFTGGGAEGAKFDADYADRPKLEGTMNIDIGRLRATNAEDWGLGVIALTLRDLMDGDITFGFGTSKGYGACKSEITSGLTELKKKLNSMNEWHKNLIKHLNTQSLRKIS